MANSKLASGSFAFASCALVREEADRSFSAGVCDIVQRRHSFVLMENEEGKSRVSRLLLLPPGGCTGLGAKGLSPHPEVRNAKIEVLGGVAPNLAGFRPIVEGIIFRHTKSPHESAIRETNLPWKNPTYVVRENYFGFLHNIINASAEWALLFLDKELVQRNDFDAGAAMKKLPPSDEFSASHLALSDALYGILTDGHDFFENSPAATERLSSALVSLPNRLRAVPLSTLVDALNMREAGRHEACTVFEMLHKIAKNAPQLASALVGALSQALLEISAPPYYVCDLLRKIGGEDARHALESALQNEKTREYAQAALKGMRS
jgi:hypothetical protein